MDNPYMGSDEYWKLRESLTPDQFRRLHTGEWVPEKEMGMDRVGISQIDEVLNDMDRAFDDILVQHSHGNGPVMEILNEMRQVMVAKGHDYSGTYHTFMSFEWQSSLTGNTPENAFLVLIAHKVARLIGLATQPEPPLNEPVADTWKDLGNYIVLLQAYERFKGQNGQK